MVVFGEAAWGGGTIGNFKPNDRAPGVDGDSWPLLKFISLHGP